MATYGSDFNWTSGLSTYSFASASAGCTTGRQYSSTYPPPERAGTAGKRAPAVAIAGASVVVKVTKAEDFTGKIIVASCKDPTKSVASVGRGPWTPVVGDITVVQGQCVTITVDVDSTKCSPNKLQIQSALIGDFCAQSPTADVCKDHDPNVTLPPALRAGAPASTTVAASTSTPSTVASSTSIPSTVAPSNSTASSTAASNATVTPSNSSSSSNNTAGLQAKSGGVAVNRHSTRRMVLASLFGCVAMAMATL